MTSAALPRYRFDESHRRMAAGAQYLPGGASSDYRIGPTALVLDHADGALLFDVDGNRLIDYYCGAGPIILGHNPPAVVEAVTRQLSRGVQLGGETDDQYAAAKLVTELVPCAEMARFANTGSEAVHLALRIARAATGRDTVVKVEGHYHGWFDRVFVGLPGRPNVAPGGDQPRRHRQVQRPLSRLARQRVRRPAGAPQRRTAGHGGSAIPDDVRRPGSGGARAH